MARPVLRVHKDLRETKETKVLKEIQEVKVLLD
jgi:hypothetical protein